MLNIKNDGDNINIPLDDEAREQRLSELRDVLKTKISADIGDTKYKFVLVDTTIDCYIDAEDGEERIRIVKPELEDRCVLYCAPATAHADRINEDSVFMVWSKVEPWKQSGKRSEIATKLADYNEKVKFVNEIDKTTEREKKKRARIIVDQAYKILISLRAEQQKRTTEYFKLLKESKSKTKFSKEVKTEASTLARSPKLLSQIKKLLNTPGIVHGKTKSAIVGDDRNKLLIVVVGVSSYMDKKLHVVVRGPPGAGKTRSIGALLLLFPNKITDIYRLTERAIDYSDNTDFDGKIILVKEFEGGKSALFSLRIIIDPETEDMKLLTVEKDAQTDKHVTVERKVKGHPVFVSTTTQMSFDPQFKDRIMQITPDETEEQTQRIFDADDEERSSFLEDLTFEYDVVRCFLDNLKPVGVKVPYKIKYPASKLKYRRTRKHFLNLIEAVAFIFQSQRLHFYKNDKEYVIATEADFNLALSLAKSIITEDILDVPVKALKLERLFKDHFDEYNANKSTPEWYSDYTKGLTLKQIREQAPKYIGRNYSRPIIRGLLEELDNADRIVSDGGKPKRWYYLESNEGEVKEIQSYIELESDGTDKVCEWLDLYDANESKSTTTNNKKIIYIPHSAL